MHFALALEKHKPGSEATNGVSSGEILKFLVFDLREKFSKMNF